MLNSHEILLFFITCNCLNSNITVTYANHTLEKGNLEQDSLQHELLVRVRI